jgi:DNA repair photolyase
MYPCWAFQQAKRQGKVKSHDEWKQPRIVVDALDLLERDLRKKKGRIERVQLCFTTDPFMVGYPDITDLSLAILKRLHEAEIRVDTLTKGLTPVDLLDTGTYGTANFYGISLVSLDEGFRQRFEPNTALYRLGRIAAIKQLQDAGLKTWVSMEPYPTPNIVEQKIEDVLEAVDFVDRIVFGKWNYSRLASDFPGANAFYVDCVDKVTDFCRTNGIEVYIKEGSR